MSHAVKTKVPGSIYVKEMRSGKKYIYYLPYKSEGKYIASGLLFSKKNVKVVESILEHLYKEHLINSRKIESNEYKVVYSISERFDHFKDLLIDKGLSPKTLYEYQYSFDIIISGDYTPDYYKSIQSNGRRIKVYEIENDIKNYLRKTNHKNNTKNKHLRHLQVFLNYLADNNDLPILNLYKKYKVKSEAKEIIPYSPKEAKMIMDKAKETDEVLYLLLRLFYLTGGRLNEWLNAYFGFDPFNVDLKNKTITFRNKIRKDQSQIIPISDKVEKVLLRLKELEEQRRDYKHKVIPYSPNSKSSITRKISKIEEELGIKQKGRSTHGFRRLLATELFENEVPVDIIKDIMRHSSIDVTMKAYRKHDKKRIKEQLNRINR